ncbi:DUF4402 domain-containing protein [Phenylobacterium hankyongense]|uniref:DUF4402 domain-containing protein n=1 Tax=Phenylobacterium hankyongense TaxID=1813876 RepID=UPI0014039539|nr:DUF4402 domain-containing protein [Phenylobacterium hankyongense]
MFALLAAIAFAPAAQAQSYSVGNASLGTIAAAASGDTSFSFNSASGAVTKNSGAGARVSAGTARASVTITCSVAYCDKGNTVVTVGSVGSPSGRAKALSAFNVTMGAGAVLASGPTGSNPVTFTLKPIGKSAAATVYIGASLSIAGDETTLATGSAASGFYLATTDSKGASSSSTSGSATATVFRRLSIAKGSDLAFGRIVKPATGTGGVVSVTTAGARVASGGAILLSSTFSRAAYTVTGEGGQTLAVTVPSSFTMSNGTNALSVTTSNTAIGITGLTGSLGAAGTYSFYVGGSIPIAPATPTGAYAGTFAVTVAYN